MATNPKRFTADDLWDMPVPDHLLGYELVDGELVEVSPPALPHARIAATICRLIGSYIEDHRLGGEVYVEGGYVLGLARDPERMRGPDVSYVSEARLQRYGGEPEHGWARFVPDLAIEIDSPGRRPRIEKQRIQDWLDAGVRLLWVVHTKTRTATVCHPEGSARVLQEDEAFDGEDVLPGFTLPLSKLFRT